MTRRIDHRRIDLKEGHFRDSGSARHLRVDKPTELCISFDRFLSLRREQASRRSHLRRMDRGYVTHGAASEKSKEASKLVTLRTRLQCGSLSVVDERA